MYPPYRYMDPYPQTYSHHRDQNANAYAYYYPPSWESMPPQMKPDSSRPPLNSGPWAYNSHVNPDCNACCNHSYPPGYYSYRPPYSHFQPPPQLYYHGPYPSFPDSYPAYFVPPPSYSVDKPIYDYDKDQTHCCRCANHTCRKREDNSVKIEEQNPEEEEKGSDSAKLIRLPNYPHPVVWIPPSLTRDREANKSAESQPGFWIPFDLNSLKGLRQGGEEKKNRQNEEKKAQSPLPIVWMPSHGKPEEVVKELEEVNPNPKVNPNLKVPEELPPTFKIIPLKVHENDSRTEKPDVTGDESSKPIHSEVRSTDKGNKIKIVPVKQLKEEDEKKLMVQEKVKERSNDKNGAGVRKEENVSKKSSDKKETPSAKSSKLPPVCLRVDPLPRRKTANGTSRSPSPPAKKQEEKKDNMYDPKDAKEEKHKEEVKAINIDDQSAKRQKKETVVPITFMREMPNGIPVVDVREHEGKQKAENANVLKASDGVYAGAVGNTKGEDISNNMTCESPKSEKMEERKERRSISSTDAAVLIQSAYRGYEVRRWQPLEKLKKIAHIHKQAGDVRRQIDDIHTSSKQLEPKQKMVIGETIMNLLLQLDTIQGLHPSVREIRKSVAKELVCLQEKLDSLASEENQEQETGKIDVDTITSDQVQSITGSSVEGGPNHVDKSLQRPLDENNMVKQLPDNEALEMGSEQEVHAEVTKYMEPLLPSEDEIVSPSNAYFVEHLLEEKPNSGTEMVLESHPVDLEQCSGVEDPCVLPATLGCEPEVIKLSREDKAPDFGVMELSEAERTVKSDELGPLSHELPDSRAGSSQDKEDELITDECSLSPREKASNLDESVVLNTDECGEVTDECGEVTDSGFELSQAKEDEQIVEECSLLLAKEASDLKEAILNTNECGTGESDFGTGMSFLQRETSPPETQEEPKVHAQLVEEGGHAEEVLEDGDYLICQPDSEPIIYEHSSSATLKAESTETTAEQHVESTVMAGNSTEVHDEMLVQSESYPSETLENATEEKPGNYTASPVEPGEKVATSDAMGLEGLASEPAFEQNNDEEGSQALTEELGVDHPCLAAEPSVELNIDEYSSQALTSGATDSHEEVVLPVPRKRGTTEETKLLEENEKLREMLERLLEAGKQQLGVISDLNGRVKDLEKKLSQNKKKTKVRRHNRASLRCSSLQQKL